MSKLSELLTEVTGDDLVSRAAELEAGAEYWRDRADKAEAKLAAVREAVAQGGLEATVLWNINKVLERK